MSLTEKYLLIVDDSTVNIELMFDLLDEYGFENIHGINDPRQVLHHCQQQLPDLLLLDIRMPHLDGYAVIEQLSTYFAEQMPPIIVLTAQIDHDTRQRALTMGVRDFITKPFQQDEVLQRICNTLNIEHRYQVRDKEAGILEQMVAKRTLELDRQSRTDPTLQLPNRRGLSLRTSIKLRYFVPYLHKHFLGSILCILFIGLCLRLIADEEYAAQKTCYF